LKRGLRGIDDCVAEAYNGLTLAPLLTSPDVRQPSPSLVFAKRGEAKVASKKALFLPILTLFTFSSLGALLWTSNNLYGRQSTAKTLTSAVEIVEKVPGEGASRISFRNASSKSINALQVSVGGSVFMVEFLDADEPKRRLKPGGIYEEWFPTTSPGDIDVSVLAVVFEDKTGAGDERLVEEVLETRRGVKKQLMRFGVVLRQTLAAANVDATTLDKLNAQLDGSVDDDPSDSGGVRLGQRKARQQIRHDLEALKRRVNIEPHFDIRNGLTMIEKRHSQRVAEIQ
jgi:hypothetical protein